MKKFLLLLIAWFVVIHIYAQDASSEPYKSTQKKYTFAIQPMQWFNLAWRFDFEIRLGDGPGWLQFAPSIYFSTKEVDNPNYYYDGNISRNIHHHGWYFREPYSKLRGGGLDVNYKRFTNPERTCYFAAGLSYRHFDINYWGWAWGETYIEDGLEYRAYTLDYHTQHINRLGINCFFGYQKPTKGAYLFDIFGGFSYRHSFLDKDKPTFLYGHTGIMPMVGMRFGFGLR
jgi:hypothetical protein